MVHKGEVFHYALVRLCASDVRSMRPNALTQKGQEFNDSAVRSCRGATFSIRP